MPLHEAVATPPQEAIAETALALPVEPETAAQSYEYTRQDGTVEHAANREEAIKLCPVLGKLAMNDPESANLLLDMASIGQAKMTEKAERPKSEAPKQPEPAAKSKPEKPIEQAKVRSIEKVANATRTDAAMSIEPTQKQTHGSGYSPNVASKERIPAEVMPKQSSPVISEREKVVVGQVEPEQRLRAAQPAQQQGPLIDRLAYEQQIYEATKIIAARETDTDFVPPELQPDVAEVASQAFLREAFEDTQILEPAERQPLVRQEQTTHRMISGLDVKLTDEWAVFDKGLVPQKMVEREDEKTTLEPTIYKQVELTDTTSAMSEIVSNIEQVEPVSWTDELDKEPLQIYENFTEALQLLIHGELPVLEIEDELTTIDDAELVVVDETQVAEIVPVITITVAERLGELADEDKEITSTIIADIVQTVHSIRVFSAEETIEPEAANTAQAELEELVITLFERLGIEYESEDIEQFIAILLRPDFQPTQPEVTERIAIDLEHDGTHEAKHHSPQIFSGMADDKNRTQDFLGKLILFYVIGRRPRTRMLAY